MPYLREDTAQYYFVGIYTFIADIKIFCRIQKSQKCACFSWKLTMSRKQFNLLFRSIDDQCIFCNFSYSCFRGVNNLTPNVYIWDRLQTFTDRAFLLSLKRKICVITTRLWCVQFSEHLIGSTRRHHNNFILLNQFY